MAQTLRPYQQTARENIHSEWENGHLRTLLILPTGTGKTIVFASVAADHGIREAVFGGNMRDINLILPLCLGR